MSLSPEIKIAERRLGTSQSAVNVSLACKQRGVSRTQFYEYKRRFQTHGIEGLVDLPPIHYSHPFTTPPEVEQRILDASLEHPAWGCNRLCDQLKLEGINRAPPHPGALAFCCRWRRQHCQGIPPKTAMRAAFKPW